MSRVFDKIADGLNDAIAYVEGDTSRGRETTRQVVSPHIKIQHSSLYGQMEPTVFDVPNQISKDYPPLTPGSVAEIIYNITPATFYDKVDGECTMGWLHARQDRPQEYLDAVSKTNDILQSRIPLAELIKFLGVDGILRQTAKFTQFYGSNWFVETRFGNFHWKDPSGDGDDTFTFFEGNMTEFTYHIHMAPGKDKGRHLIASKCGRHIELLIPQLDT